MAGVTWFLARAGARRRLWSGVGLVLLVGLTGTVVLTAWAGARRTASSYERLNESVNHADLTVATEGDPALFDPTIALDGPGVAQAGIANGYAMAEMTDDGLVDLATQNALIAPVGPTAFYEIDRLEVLEGRPPDPGAAEEIAVPEAMRDRGYSVGRELDICMVDFSSALEFGQGVLQGTASIEAQRAFVDEVCTIVTLRVVGITAPGPDEVVRREDSEADNFPIASPAFVEESAVPSFFSFVLVDLERGAEPGPYVDAVLDRTEPDAGVSVQAASLRASVVDRTLEPYVRTFLLFAAAVALAGLGVLGPAIVRWAGTPEADRATLRAVGLRPHQLRAASAVRGATLAAASGLVAVVSAAWLSDRFPRGLGARIEPDPGRRIDGPVLAIGFVVIVLLGAAFGALASTSDRPRVRRPSRVAESMQGLGLGPASIAGVRSALAGDGGGAAGVVRTIAGVAVAVAAVVTAITYQAGLTRLLDTPSRYGWAWNEVIDAGDSAITPELIDALVAEPDVEGVSVGYRSTLARGGAEVQLFAFDRVHGDTYPVILDGRAPEGTQEIALGGQTLDRLAVELGDRIDFRGPQGQPVRLTVVGRTLLPLLSLGADLSVAEGGLVDVALVESFETSDVAMALVDLAPGAPERVVQEIIESGRDGQLAGLGVAGPELTADLRGYDAVRNTPLALAGALALLGLGVLAHTVTMSVRQRRRELAVLRCLGFVGRQLRTSVRWSVLTIVGACVVVAVPAGIAAGRLLWERFATGIGVDSSPVTPALPAILVGAAAVLAALLFALVPGRQATALEPAEVLRSE